MDDLKLSQFSWTQFYSEFADKLLQFKNNRNELLVILQKTYDELKMNYPFNEKDGLIEDMCPFTVFGCFNKGITNENRKALMSHLGKQIGVQAPVPTDFDGIPVLNNMKAWFFAYKENRQQSDIPNLWLMFEAAINYADAPSEASKQVFIEIFDKVRSQLGIKWNLSIGLYWIRPNSYLNLDEKSRTYLKNEAVLGTSISKLSSLKQVPDAKTYLQIIDLCKGMFDNPANFIHSFPELSRAAFKNSVTDDESKSKVSKASFIRWFVPLVNALKKLRGSATPEQARKQIVSDLSLPDDIVNETRGKTGVKKFDNEVAFARLYLVYEGFIDKSVKGQWKLTDKGWTSELNEEDAGAIFLKWVDILKEQRESQLIASSLDAENPGKRYWMYAPGDKSSKWSEFYEKGIMAVEWDEMGDLKQYSSKDAMKAKMKELYGSEYTYMNSALATWQFANELRPGDIVYAKKGIHKLVGRGIITSEYLYDDSRAEYKSVRQINWTHDGEWDHPGRAVLKTLTDITPYTEYVQKLEDIFAGTGEITDQEEIEVVYEQYSDQDFLHEVFMDVDSYESLVSLLKNKKNVILQGPPGVGKTFAAKRLAYSIMGEKDTSRVMMVQFHQSYSYEDFIMGFRPNANGFELTEGPFYQFCKTAQDDNERPYYFIIDEINRGNLSKIFGELLMLIEMDKRGEKLRLLYSNELFSVPSNVHIIGMMNTADRSLAMIDYALRRRFAFFSLEPSFDTAGFEAMMVIADNPKLESLVERVKELNMVIAKDESLGEGFRIGHSYLCANTAVTDDWVESVVKYELIPLISEYWFDEPSKIEYWTNKLYGALND